MSSIATVVTPRNRTNGCSRSRRLSIWTSPFLSSGTPVTTFPNATPSNRARPNDDAEKTESQSARQRELSRLPRNSIATVRRIRAISTNISAQ